LNNVSKRFHQYSLRFENGNILTAQEDSGVVITSKTSAAARGSLAQIVGWPLAHVDDVVLHGTIVGIGPVVAVVRNAVGASLEAVGLVGGLEVFGEVELGNLSFNFVVLSGDAQAWCVDGTLLERKEDLVALGVTGFDHLGDDASGGDGDHAEGEEAECEHVEVLRLVVVLTAAIDTEDGCAGLLVMKVTTVMCMM